MSDNTFKPISETQDESSSMETLMVMDLVRRMGAKEDVAELCGRLISANAEGDVCIELSPEEQNMLADTTAVAMVPENNEKIPACPFLLDGSRLYSRRDWLYEHRIKERIQSMAIHAKDNAITIPEDGIFAQLNKKQREGVSMMCNNRFSILTGGPGTGKTYTIARAVKLIQKEMAAERLELSPTATIALAAPTGKAAARIKESMAGEAQNLGLEHILEATTLHTLLQPNADFVTFKHNKHNPLPLGWLIVDEASMIDQPMMAKLLDALPKDCRLTLVGDEHQLASVERGHVFGDLCRMQNVAKCELTESKRFVASGEIHALAQAINQGDGDGAIALLKNSMENIHFTELPQKDKGSPRLWKGFDDLLCVLFRSLKEQTTPDGALAALNDCRILCAFRHGPYGTETLNAYVQKILGSQCPIPMMITKNDHGLAVSNGDVGIYLPGGANREIHLETTDKRPRALPLALAPDTEMAFASTIHKSQGSEYKNVIIVLPPDSQYGSRGNDLLTRETLYTAITRTKGSVYIFAGEKSIRVCCENKIQRRTGLCK